MKNLFIVLITILGITFSFTGIGLKAEGHKSDSPGLTSDLKLEAAERDLRALYFEAGVQRMEVPVRAPDFALKELGNGTISLQDLRGRAVILNFFSPTCPACQKEATSFDKLSAGIEEKELVVLQIGVEAAKKELKRFKREFHISLPILMDESGSTAEAYGVWGHHESFFIDRRGMIVGKTFMVGDWNSPNMKKLIQHLLTNDR